MMLSNAWEMKRLKDGLDYGLWFWCCEIRRSNAENHRESKEGKLTYFHEINLFVAAALATVWTGIHWNDCAIWNRRSPHGCIGIIFNSNVLRAHGNNPVRENKVWIFENNLKSTKMWCKNSKISGFCHSSNDMRACGGYGWVPVWAVHRCAIVPLVRCQRIESPPLGSWSPCPLLYPTAASAEISKWNFTNQMTLAII